jgi:hypothetical protein
MMITIFLKTAISVHPKPCILLPGSGDLRLSFRFQTLTDLPESTEVPEDRTLAGGVLANVKADTEEVMHEKMCRSNKKDPKRPKKTQKDAKRPKKTRKDAKRPEKTHRRFPKSPAAKTQNPAPWNLNPKPRTQNPEP